MPMAPTSQLLENEMIKSRALYISLALMFLIVSKPGLCSSLKYFKQMTGLEGDQAKTLHKELKEQSKTLSFLDCPIEMIERQWGGIHSVNLGLNYLQQYINESNNAVPNYDKITGECEKDLNIYRQKDKDGQIRSRAIVGDELNNFMATANAQNQNLFMLVSTKLNQETRCYTQRADYSLGYLVVGNFGMHYLDCYTPLGRRFSLHGPAIGAGIGTIIASTVPNIDKYNALSHSIMLYQQKEKDVYHIKKTISKGAFFAGASVEHDKARYFLKRESGQSFFLDVRFSLGIGAAFMKVHSFTTRDDDNPLYIELGNVLNLQQMAETVQAGRI